MPLTVSEKTMNEWFGEILDVREIHKDTATAETRKIGFTWTESPLGPRAHHPAWPNAESINVLGIELTRGWGQSRPAWAAKANSTMTPGCWNSPGFHPLESMPLGQASAGSSSSTAKPGACFFYTLLFSLPTLGVSLSLSLSIRRIHSTSADEFSPQHSTPLSLQNSSLGHATWL